jgi:hypothetical protein
MAKSIEKGAAATATEKIISEAEVWSEGDSTNGSPFITELLELATINSLRLPSMPAMVNA